MFLAFFASFMAGCYLAIVEQSFYVLSTRLYNQSIKRLGNLKNHKITYVFNIVQVRIEKERGMPNPAGGKR